MTTALELAYYRVSANQRSSNKFHAVRRLFNFYRNYLGFPSPIASSCVARWIVLNMLSRKKRFLPANDHLSSMLISLHSRGTPP